MLFTCNNIRKYFKIIVISLIFSSSIFAQNLPSGLPENSYLYLPILNNEIDQYAKEEFKYKSIIAGQIEQETCISLKHKFCWNPLAELKTDREYGFGLGQITITEKFNKFEELKSLHPSLKSWKWVERFDADKQLRSIILLDLDLYKKIYWTSSYFNKLAFMLSAYNGGYGGLLNDKKLCDDTLNCNSQLWFNNVAETSWKSKTKLPQYGESFFNINRNYVRNIFAIRSSKYKFMDE
jgi:hypothetical protein